MENDNIIRLNFEDGEYGEFEILDSIEYEGNEYVVLLSATIPTRQMKSLTPYRRNIRRERRILYRGRRPGCARGGF